MLMINTGNKHAIKASCDIYFKVQSPLNIYHLMLLGKCMYGDYQGAQYRYFLGSAEKYSRGARWPPLGRRAIEKPAL